MDLGPDAGNPDAVRDACRYAALIFVLVLAVPAKTHRLARLFRAQQKWAELMERHDSPRCIVCRGSCKMHDRGN